MVWIIKLATTYTADTVCPILSMRYEIYPRFSLNFPKYATKVHFFLKISENGTL